MICFASSFCFLLELLKFAKIIITISLKSHSLYELNEHIRRVMALNYAEALWLRCEIAQLKESRGNYFIELIEKAEDAEEIIAQSSAVLWGGTYRSLRMKLGKAVDSILNEGMEVLIKIKIDFHERYGLKLIIEDINPAFTLGKLAIKRQEIIDQLKSEDLLYKNELIPLPFALQRIAVISSAQAAGYQDFEKQIVTNPFGYRFKTKLFATAVQGVNVEREILQQLKKIRRFRDNYDCMVIIRGGGAKLDLMAFDSYELAKAIAEFPIPVITGIGHDVDETVADMVAHTSLKTPTAVADFLVNHNMAFESSILEYGLMIKNEAMQQLNAANYQLNNIEHSLQIQSDQIIKNNQYKIQQIETIVPQLTRFKLKTEQQQLNSLEKMTRLLDIETTLKRGFSLTTQNGALIQSTNQIKVGTEITTLLKDGTLISTVQKKENGKK